MGRRDAGLLPLLEGPVDEVPVLPQEAAMLDKTFNFKDVEPRIYAQWEESGAFRAGRRPDAEPFCIVIPPPNVTGRLLVGHALNNTLQVVLTRFERMRH